MILSLKYLIERESDITTIDGKFRILARVCNVCTSLTKYELEKAKLLLCCILKDLEEGFVNKEIVAWKKNTTRNSRSSSSFTLF